MGRQEGPLVGYARTSTIEQQAGLEAQQCGLRTAGCRNNFLGADFLCRPRAQLEAALDYGREDDTLVTKLDRLARSARHLSELVHQLEAKGLRSVSLTFAEMPWILEEATGRLMHNMFCCDGAVRARDDA